jgi:hypothetical protein
MPQLLNARHEQFAQALARGGTGTQAYLSAGYCPKGARQNASRLRKQPDVCVRVEELTANIAAAQRERWISDRNERLRALDKLWKRLRSVWDQILAERGRELAHVPGGETGFLVCTYKGKNADIPVYKVDPGILALSKALRVLEETAAKELGEWPRSRGRPRSLAAALRQLPSGYR